MIVQKGKKVTKKSKKSSSSPQKRMDESIEIFGVSLSSTRKGELLKKMWLQRKEMLHVATVNPEYIMEARRNPTFKLILTQCLSVADGHGVVWGAKILHDRIIERISGVELVEEILKHADLKQEKVFLLGAGQGVAELAAKEMRKKYPRAEFAWYEGARTVKVEKDEEASMTIAKINGFEPDYLLVAYGSPWQDLWIEENRQYLRAKVAVGVGGTLDEWAGVVKICPSWIDRLGMKWLWRLFHEPWRFKRIAKVLHFAGLVLYHKLID